MLYYSQGLHIKSKGIVSTLTSILRQKHNQRNIRVIKGDKIKAMRGKFKGKSGMVNRIDIKRRKVYVEGYETIKKDGTKVLIPVDPSNLQITELLLDDKFRLKRK